MSRSLSSTTARHLSDLSPHRQKLVRLCQYVVFGSVRGLEIRDGEPVFDPPPVVQVDLKLDGEDPPRLEMKVSDFELSREVVRLVDRLDDGNVTAIELLEVRAGIPRRAILRFGRQAVPAGVGAGGSSL